MSYHADYAVEATCFILDTKQCKMPASQHYVALQTYILKHLTLDSTLPADMQARQVNRP